MCGVLIDESDEAKLKNLGTKDSKLLTSQAREKLFTQIQRIALAHKLIIIPPQEVDGYLLTDHLNLNKLEAQKMAEIINILNPNKTILDCPSNNIKSYMDYLRRFLTKKESVISAEHKADVKYTVVAAASILAKVTRDKEIQKLKDKIGIDFGSGYPSDEITQKFLKENWDKHPSLFRKTWSSYKRVVQASKQRGLDEFQQNL